MPIKNKDTEESKGHRGATRARRRSSFVSSVTFVSSVLAALAIAACRQDMHDQPKYVPLRQSAFFNDARSARPLVEGTVARGQLHDDELMYTGKVKGEDAAVFPMRVDAAVMRKAAADYASAILEHVPEGPDRTYMLRKHREVALLRDGHHGNEGQQHD